MVTETTEPTTDQTLEQVLKNEASTEQPEVSETLEETPNETVEETTEESKEEVKVDPEFEKRVSTEVQSRSDKMTNEYREKRESDTALLRDLRQQLSEAKKQGRTKTDDRLISSILSGDEEQGIDEDVTKSKEKALKEFNERYQEYKNKSSDIEESAEFISSMSAKLPQNVVKEFGLDDPNPSLRAVNGVNFVNEAIALHKRNIAFQEVVDIVLAKGSEVRQQIESFTGELVELSDKKGRDLLLDKIRSGLNVTPKKAPATPSGILGGKDWAKATSEDLITEGLRQDKLKKK